jgi:hypothetical protein
MTARGGDKGASASGYAFDVPKARRVVEVLEHERTNGPQSPSCER